MYRYFRTKTKQKNLRKARRDNKFSFLQWKIVLVICSRIFFFLKLPKTSCKSIFFLQNSKSSQVVFVQTFRIMIAFYKVNYGFFFFFFLVNCLVVGLGSGEIARFSEKTKNKSHFYQQNLGKNR